MGANAGASDASPQPRATIVLGAQWGDEGKGKITDLLAAGADVIVRFQGGANAGHTVVIGERQLILHQIPSGVTSEGALNVIGNGCVVDLIGLVEELEQLRGLGIAVTPENLMLSERAHLVTPAHKLIDRLQGKAIGTTGRGIGPCYTDKARRSGVRAESVVDGSLRDRLAQQASMYREIVGSQYADEVDDLDGALDMAALIEASERLAPFIGDATAAIFEAYSGGRRILYEGAQGAFLDIDHGTYPFVTSSNTTIGGAFSGSGVYLDFDRRIGVVKAYTTRVGNGPFPTELEGALGEGLRTRGAEFGATTGRPRRCGWLDLHILRRSIVTNGFTEIALTKLDVLSELPTIEVALGRDKAGEPTYQTLPGWEAPIDGARRFEDLPERCQGYIALIEDQLGLPVRTISVGPERTQTITRP